jgi:flavin reductase (DIM6/NTAB) family NADH-FMN oxidoreductase RutF
MKPISETPATLKMASEHSDALTPQALRRVMAGCATSVMVITTATSDGRREGVTANSFATVSLNPPLILWCLARKSRSFETFKSAEHFAVNVLASDQAHLSRHFAAPQVDKFAGVDCRPGLAGCPILAGVLATFECRTETLADGGDHLIIVGRVLAANRHAGAPLVYQDGAYQQLVRPEVQL